MKRKFISTIATVGLAISLLSACGADYKVTFHDFWKLYYSCFL